MSTVVDSAAAAEPLASDASVVRPTRERNIGQLPSGNWRVRIKWKGRVVPAVVATKEAAIELRDELMRRLIDEDIEWPPTDDGYEGLIMGMKPLRAWPHIPGVYFATIRGLDLVKIGTAVNIYRRLVELKCAAPRLALLAVQVGGRREEAELHQRFTVLHEEGEWFALRGGLLNYIREIRAGRDGARR